MNITVESSGLPLLPMQVLELTALPARWQDAARCITLQLDSVPAPAALRAALQLWQGQHDALRLRIGQAAGYRGLRQFFQREAAAVDLPWLAAGDTAGRQAWFEREVDVQAGAGVAVLVCEQAEGRCQLVLGVLAALVDARRPGRARGDRRACRRALRQPGPIVPPSPRFRPGWARRSLPRHP